MVKKILAVDNEKSIIELEKEVLEREGFIVVAAYNGKEALEKIKLEIPDLVILDIDMPEIDGYGVCKKIEQDLQGKLPVIILSAEDIEENGLKRFRFVKDYISKPFNYKELIIKVKKLLTPIQT